MNAGGFRDLEIWKKGITITDSIYNITEKFPKNETYGLSSQMQRASVSVPSNIAEGYRRSQKKDNIRFLRISLGSLAELETQLVIAFRRNYFTKDIYNLIIKDIDLEGRMIMKYIQYVDSK